MTDEPSWTTSASPPPWLYLPSDWGKFWNPAKAAAGSALARVGIVGDSIAQLFDASTRANSWAGRLAAQLQASYGDGGSGFQGVANTALYAASEISTGYTAAQLGVILTGAGWSGINAETTENNGDGPGAVGIFTGANGNTATFTVRGTSVTLYWLAAPAGGTINWTIDGVAQTPINTAAGSTSQQTTTVSGLSGGPHTVVLTASVSGTFVNLFGCRGFNASGVVVDNYARTGAQSAAYVTQAHANYGLPAAWSGGQSAPCDLLIYALGTNDANSGITADAYAENMRAHLTQVRDAGAMNGATDLLFLMPHIGKFDGATPRWQDYLARLRGIAASYGAAVVDVWGLYRNSYAYAQNLGYFSNGHTGTGAAGSDNVHPGDTGHQLIYNALARVGGVL